MKPSMMYGTIHFPQKIYKLRHLSLSQFVYFLREREEIFFTYFVPLSMEFLNKFKLLITMCGSGETFLTIREPMLPFASKSVFFPLKKAKKKPTKASLCTYWH